MPWQEWIRTVEVEPSLYGADFAHLGEQIEVAAARRRAASSTSTSATGTSSSRSRWGRSCSQSISPMIHAADGAIDVHLMVDEPGEALRSRRGRGRRQRHLPLSRPSTTCARRFAPRASRSCRSGVAFNPETEPEAVAAVRRRRRPRALHERSIPATPASRSRRRRTSASARLRASAARRRSRSRSTAASRIDNIKRLLRRAARRCSSPRRRSSAREDLPRAYRRLVQLLA